MKKKILSLCVAALMSIAHSYGGVTLTIPDVSIAPGGTSNVVINFDLGTQPYTAYQFDIAYPEGISPVVDDDNNPTFTSGGVYSGHSVSSCFAPDGKARFQCFSVNSDAFTAQSGTLLILPITAQKSLAEGTYQATISPIEFVQTDATPDRPDAITFNIVVSNNVVLDELSTLPPTAATGVNVRVMRTIKANEWSTIVLPFAITQAQLQTAFGNDVNIQLADFTGYEVSEQGDDIVGINVSFATVNAIEANHPYIIKVSKAVTEINVSGVNIEPVDKPMVATIKRTNRHWSEFIGTYVANTTVPENTLFLNENKFWYSTGATKMKAFRAYFDFFDVLSSVESAASRIVMTIDNTSTGIDEIIDHTSVNDPCYDLQGRQTDASQRVKSGLYIRNGQKVIVK